MCFYLVFEALLFSYLFHQVMSLQQKGVRSDYLGSTQTNRSVITFAQSGLYDVLYLTPEKAISLPDRYPTAKEMIIAY